MDIYNLINRKKFIDDLFDKEKIEKYELKNLSELNVEIGKSFNISTILNKNYYNFIDIMLNIKGGKLNYINSGTTGHTFRGDIEDKDNIKNYAMKVVAYRKKIDSYGNIYDIRRPENTEIMMLNNLSKFVINNITPHILLPIITFNTDIKEFTDLINKGLIVKEEEKYQSFIRKYKEDYYHENVSILISEWGSKGDLLNYIKKNHQIMTLEDWKIIFFQIIFTLSIIQQKYPSFRHNDLKANNILLTDLGIKTEYIDYYYSYDNKKINFKVPNNKIHTLICDFDFSCISGIVTNRKVEDEWANNLNITPYINRYYDIHYLFYSLKNIHCKEIFKHLHPEVNKFIDRVIPINFSKDKIVSKGRIGINIEHTIPKYLILYDDFFSSFRENISPLEKFLDTNVNNLNTIEKNLSVLNFKNISKLNINKKKNKTYKDDIMLGYEKIEKYLNLLNK